MGLDKPFRAIAKLVRIIFGTEYFAQFSILLSLYYAGAIKRKMRGNVYDIICAPASNIELAYVKTHLPIILIADSTFQLLTHYYLADFRKMSRLSRWEGNLLEKRSLKKSRLNVFSSEWAAGSAIKDYKVDARKRHHHPSGRQYDQPPRRRDYPPQVWQPPPGSRYCFWPWSGAGRVGTWPSRP